MTLGPLEDPDLIMGMGSGLLGAVPVSHLETLTGPGRVLAMGSSILPPS